MVLVSRLNGEAFYINSDHIECIEETPDTVIAMESGRKFVVTEPAEEVIRRIVEYRRRILEGMPLTVGAAHS